MFLTQHCRAQAAQRYLSNVVQLGDQSTLTVLLRDWAIIRHFCSRAVEHCHVLSRLTEFGDVVTQLFHAFLLDYFYGSITHTTGRFPQCSRKLFIQGHVLSWLTEFSDMYGLVSRFLVGLFLRKYHAYTRMFIQGHGSGNLSIQQSDISHLPVNRTFQSTQQLCMMRPPSPPPPPQKNNKMNKIKIKKNKKIK